MDPFPIDFLRRMANSRNLLGRPREVFLYIYSDGIEEAFEAIAKHLNMSSSVNVRQAMSTVYKSFNDNIGSSGGRNKRQQLHAHLENEYLLSTEQSSILDTIHSSPAHFTASYFVNGKKQLQLLEYITVPEWSDIFCFVIDRLNDHDIVDLLERMQDRVDNLLSRDVLLQKFLCWVKEQSELLLLDLNQNICPTAVRGCYFDFDIALDINRSLSSEIAPGFTRDFICASLMARMERSDVRSAFPKISDIRGLQEEYGIDPAMAIVFGQSRVVQSLIERVESSSLKSSLKRLYTEIFPLLPTVEDENPVGRLTKDLELWGEELRDAIVPYWSLGEKWRYTFSDNDECIVVFNDNQKKKLESYYYANKTLIRCLMHEKVSEYTRQNMLPNLLLPISKESQINDDRLVDYEPLFYIPSMLVPESKTSEKLAYILNISQDNHHKHEKIISDIECSLQTILDAAFIDRKSEALLEIHKIIFQIYETSLSRPDSIICTHEHSTWLVDIRNRIETAWIEFELQDLTASNGSMPSEAVTEDPEKMCDWIKEQANYRSETDQKLLEFFKEEARDKHFRIFIQSDAILNYRFCDALAFAQIHYSENVKAEIVHNMWDEVGHGIPFKLHSREFTKILNDLNLERPKASIWGEDWRPYYGHNLYFLFGLNRKNYLKSLGSLTMPELFDPRRDQAIVDGLKREYLNSISYDFYAHHIETDMRHGQKWLENVISPIIRYRKENGREVAIGCLLRMNSMRYYNQYLMDRFEDKTEIIR